MAILYKCEVANCYSLNVRSGPSMSSPPVAWLQRGDIVMVDGEKNGWYKLQGQERYCYKTYLNIKENLSTTQVAPTPSPAPPPQPTNAARDVSKLLTNPLRRRVNTASDASNGYGLVNIADEDVAKDSSIPVSGSGSSIRFHTLNNEPWGAFYIHTNSSYPTAYQTRSGIPSYDYYMDHKSSYGDSESLVSMMNSIQKNMNIPSIYTREDLTRKVHQNFNRFQMGFPDLQLRSTHAVIIFTRPDINIYNSGRLTNMVANDPRFNLLATSHPELAQLLTKDGPGVGHKFNPLLSNLAQSIDVSDDQVDTLETGETYTGYKMSYSKHNVKSITSNSISIKFKETYDLAVTNIHQMWVDYQSNVYIGKFEPTRQRIANKELDYACDIYYFLLGDDGETIKFWTKYYGAFPTNVPKSAYSWDAGSPVSLPEHSVTYNYIYKEDSSPVALMEFNMNANIGAGQSSQRAKTFLPQSGINGTTWVGAPFIYSYYYNNGISNSIQGFKLGWKPA